MQQIYELLEKDHREVQSLLQQIEDALEDEDFDHAEDLFQKAKAELTAHSKAEEEVFYEPLKVVSLEEEGEELAWEGEEEHHVVALLLNELSRLGADEDAWKAKLKVLSELVDHHIEEEEGEIFEEARKCFSDEDAEEIAENFEELKETYLSMVDEALAADIEIFNNPVLSGGGYQEELR